MVKQNTDSFIYGKDEYPSWFALASQVGTVKYIYSGGALADTLIATTKGFESAKVGDTIMVVGNSMVVIPAATAKAYGVE